MTLAMIVPSRDRPHNIEPIVADWYLADDAELFVAYDEDQIDLYPRLDPANYSVFPRTKMCPKLNACAELILDDFTHIGFMGDDHRPRTQGWDTALCEAAGDNGMAYAEDLFGAHFPTSIVMGSSLVRAWGWMVPPGIEHLCCDWFWKDVGEKSNRITYCPDVVIEHMHPAADKAPWDDLYGTTNFGTEKPWYDEWVAEGGLDRAIAAMP